MYGYEVKELTIDVQARLWTTDSGAAAASSYHDYEAYVTGMNLERREVASPVAEWKTEVETAVVYELFERAPRQLRKAA